MDLVLDALEISSIRATYLTGNVMRYLGRQNAPFELGGGRLGEQAKCGTIRRDGASAPELFSARITSGMKWIASSARQRRRCLEL